MKLQYLDFLCAAFLIIVLNLVQKYNKCWLVYSFLNLMFAALMWYKGLLGMAIMGAILFFTGINNYRKGKLNQT